MLETAVKSPSIILLPLKQFAGSAGNGEVFPTPTKQRFSGAQLHLALRFLPKNRRLRVETDGSFADSSIEALAA
jgi:hypothetical protein